MSLITKSRKIHFVGIGGIGMSGLAELVLQLGHSVTGSDLSEGESVQRLKKLGAKTQVGHSASLLEKEKPDVIVFSTAITNENPELMFAKKHQIPLIRRAEMLAEIMRLKRGIAIAGSHGKTTTTGIVAQLLQSGNLDPTVVIGGKFDAIGSNAAWGAGAWIVAEADESDGSFLRLAPEIAVVTNIDREHMDHYKNFEASCQAFEDFLDRLPFYGQAILCSDSEALRLLDAKLKKPRFWYGFNKDHEPDYWVKDSVGASGRTTNPFSPFEIYKKSDGYKNPWLSISLSVPGHHNRMNATAAALVADFLGLKADTIQTALKDFRGVRRRFELRGHWKGHPVIEDYAHHPTEIKATLEACESVYGSKKPWVLFQPHRYSRTRDLWKEFSSCFEGAATVFTLPIYAASESREAWVDSVDRENFAKNIESQLGRFSPDIDSLAQELSDFAQNSRMQFEEGAPLLVLGAGDISKIISLLLL